MENSSNHKLPNVEEQVILACVTHGRSEEGFLDKIKRILNLREAFSTLVVTAVGGCEDSHPGKVKIFLGDTFSVARKHVTLLDSLNHELYDLILFNKEAVSAATDIGLHPQELPGKLLPLMKRRGVLFGYGVDTGLPHTLGLNRNVRDFHVEISGLREQAGKAPITIIAPGDPEFQKTLAKILAED